MFVKWQVVSAVFVSTVVSAPALFLYMDRAYRYIPDRMKPSLARRLMQVLAGVLFALWAFGIAVCVEYFVHDLLHLPEIPAEL